MLSNSGGHAFRGNHCDFAADFLNDGPDKTLNAAGIRTAYINSSLTPAQITKALNLAAQGTYKLIYVAPERLENEEFIHFAHKAKIAMVTVDEASLYFSMGTGFPSQLCKICGICQTAGRKVIKSDGKLLSDHRLPAQLHFKLF